MNRLRFCLITSFYPPYHSGGCGLHVHHLANLLAADGHEVEVVCSGEAHGYKIKEARAGEYPHLPGVTVRRISSGAGKTEPLLAYLLGVPVFSRRDLSESLSRRFDVIHYHNISLFGGLSLLGMGRGIKLFTQHTYWLFCPTHYLWKNRREVCGRQDCLRCLLAYRRPPQLWRRRGWMEQMLGNVDSLVMPCRFMLDRHREEGFGGRMDCLPYFVAPVDPKPDPEAERDVAALSPYFLFVARLESYKGPQAAIAAFRRAKIKANLLMVGTGTMRAELEEMARGDGRVRFLDYVAPARLDHLYRGATALLAPSVWPEMGNQTVLQAISCGTPVIVSDRGCLPELAGDGRCGMVCAGDEATAAAMERMLDPAVRRSFERSCRERYEREYSPQTFRDGYYRLIARLRSRSQGSP
ncbi:MAG: glycosyltransferase [Candidatus Aureabacteria bacterium]|nr:glycosyltransferase [Candidatus Auribacterota bacterium]